MRDTRNGLGERKKKFAGNANEENAVNGSGKDERRVGKAGQSIVLQAQGYKRRLWPRGRRGEREMEIVSFRG